MCEGVIDAFHESRYSQGQIPDLAANTIPRFLKAAQSSRFALPSPAAPFACSSNFSQTIAKTLFLVMPAVAVRGRGRSVFAPNCRQGGLLTL